MTRGPHLAARELATLVSEIWCSLPRCHGLAIGDDGAVYPLALNAFNDSELAGATFSPDGQTLFANIQHPGLTLAIWGPWGSPRH